MMTFKVGNWEERQAMINQRVNEILDGLVQNQPVVELTAEEYANILEAENTSLKRVLGEVELELVEQVERNLELNAEIKALKERAAINVTVFVEVL